MTPPHDPQRDDARRTDARRPKAAPSPAITVAEAVTGALMMLLAAATLVLTGCMG